MSEPFFSNSTEKLYYRLPAAVRNEDIYQNYQLKKWLSGVVDQAGTIDTLVDRFSYVSPEDGPGYRTADLVDPVTADAAWLPWLAQLVGVKLQPGDSVAQWRSDISNGIGGVQGAPSKQWLLQHRKYFQEVKVLRSTITASRQSETAVSGMSWW
jgi:hypothetical protein